MLFVCFAHAIGCEANIFFLCLWKSRESEIVISHIYTILHKSVFSNCRTWIPPIQDCLSSSIDITVIVLKCRWLNYHLARSMEFGTPLVFDMDYEHHMRPQEIKNTAKQLHDVYVVNRGDPTRDPFHLHFANCQPNNAILRWDRWSI